MGPNLEVRIILGVTIRLPSGFLEYVLAELTPVTGQHWLRGGFGKHCEPGAIILVVLICSGATERCGRL